MGDTVLVVLEPNAIARPLLVTGIVLVSVSPPMTKDPKMEERINGTLFCEPEDHNTAAFRILGQTGDDPARIHGRPERYHTTCYGESLRRGSALGQWRFR